MAITDTQGKINDIINKSLSANASTLGDVMRDDVASGMQDLLNEIVSMLVDIGDLDTTKLDSGTYVGDASTLKSYLEGLINACTQKGTYSGTAGQLKAMIDSLATTGTITPDLKNYMELLKTENNVKVVQGVPVGAQKYFGTGITGIPKIKFPTRLLRNMFQFEIELYEFLTGNLPHKLLVKGMEESDGFGSGTNPQINSVVILSDKPLNLPVSFCTGATESYLLIGDTQQFMAYGRIVIRNVETHLYDVDWSTGWDISIVTTLEDLDSTKKVTVTPSLNSTHLNGTMTSNTNGGITQKKSSTQALDVQNDSGTSFHKVDTINGKVTERLSSSVTPANNQEMEFQLTSNTQLTIKVKGTDGVVRSANITLT